MQEHGRLSRFLVETVKWSDFPGSFKEGICNSWSVEFKQFQFGGKKAKLQNLVSPLHPHVCRNHSLNQQEFFQLNSTTVNPQKEACMLFHDWKDITVLILYTK